MQQGDRVEAGSRAAAALRRGRLERLLRIGLGLLLAVELQAQTTTSPTNALRQLTEARQVLNLEPAEANRGYPVRLRAVVTCFDPRTQLFFVQDESAGIYVYPAMPQLALNRGQVVELEGVSNAGRFTPIVIVSKVRATGQTQAPKAKPVSIAQLSGGDQDSQWIEVEAVVRSETKDWGHLVLELADGPNLLKARVLSFPERRDASLADARVRVRGVAATHYNERGQFTGVHLIVPDYADVTALSQPRADPFSLPLSEIRKLMTYSPSGAPGHRVRVKGVVTLAWPGRGFCLQDQSGGLWVNTPSALLPRVGQLVTVAGFGTGGGYTPHLEEALFRALGPGTLPAPKPVSATHALEGKCDNELVQVEGTLEESRTTAQNEAALVLRAGQRVFQAMLPESGGRLERLGLANGSRLRLSGVCGVLADEEQRPVAFRLWLRSPADIEVLSRPSWWNPRRLLGVSLAVGTAVLCGLVWVIMLRRRVAQQTAAIRRREAQLEERCRDLFENANDIIFSCDRAGRLTSLNRAGELILGYTRQEAAQLDLTSLVLAEHRQLAQQKLAESLADATQARYELALLAKDGRRVVLEVNTRPEFKDGQATGLRGIARDITARKEAEEALWQSEHELRRALQERERLGQDLHDNIIQSIYAVGLGLEDCRRQLPDHPPLAEERLAKAMTQLNAVIRDVRDFILGLEPDLLKGQTFKEALRLLVDELGPALAEHFHLEVDPQAASLLDARQTTQLLYIVREALSNCVRHALAQTTTVSLHKQNGCIRLEVRDDGRGFDVNAIPCAGQGLRNIAARAQDLHARLAINSRPAQGTAVVLDIPPAASSL